MTDKTALLALADEMVQVLAQTPAREMSRTHDVIGGWQRALRALAEQPAEGVQGENDIGCGDHDHDRFIPGCAKCAVTLPEKHTTPPAASVDVGWVEFLEEWIGDGCLGSFEHREKFRKAARALIDSAGGAKENRWPRACPTGYYLSDGAIYPSEDAAIDAAMASANTEAKPRREAG